MSEQVPTQEGRTARDVVAEVRLFASSRGVFRLDRHNADRILHALATAGLIPSRTLIAAVIKIVWSHPEMRQILTGVADEDDFVPWPEMAVLMAELDVAAPGWREDE